MIKIKLLSNVKLINLTIDKLFFYRVTREEEETIVLRNTYIFLRLKAF